MAKKNKISALSPALTSAQFAPKIYQGQLQTLYSECPKFHPNPFTSGGVIAECVNVVETCHKVFPILGEATASLPSNKYSLYYIFILWFLSIFYLVLFLCPNLSGRILDVQHTSTHGVAPVQI